MDRHPPSGRTRTRLLMALTVALSLVVGLTAAEGILRWQRSQIEHSDHMDPGLVRYDPLLGWRLTPGWEGEHRHHDFRVRYRINDDGFRGLGLPAPGEAVTLLGDSFTFGLGVDEGETFADRLNADLPRTRFFNRGVPGYSTDQERLLLDELPAELRRRVLLVVYLGNDLIDNLRTYPLQADQAKPRFVLRDGRLRLEGIPVPRAPKPAAARRESLATLVLGPDAPRAGWLGRLELSRRLGLFQVRVELDEATLAQRLAPSLTLFRALVADMRRALAREGGHLAVALLSGRSHVEEPGSASAQYQDFLRRALRADLADLGLPVVDLTGALRDHAQRTGEALYHPFEGHLNRAGHRQVAAHLSKALADWGWLR